jgi:hypothetical protein
LRAAGSEIDQYLDYALKCEGVSRHRFIRELYMLYRKVAAALFTSAIERALKYRVHDIPTIERIITLEMKTTGHELPVATIAEDLMDRDAYRQGRFSDEVDLSIYDNLLEE